MMIDDPTTVKFFYKANNVKNNYVHRASRSLRFTLFATDC